MGDGRVVGVVGRRRRPSSRSDRGRALHRLRADGRRPTCDARRDPPAGAARAARRGRRSTRSRSSSTVGRPRIAPSDAIDRSSPRVDAARRPVPSATSGRHSSGVLGEERPDAGRVGGAWPLGSCGGTTRRGGRGAGWWRRRAGAASRARPSRARGRRAARGWRSRRPCAGGPRAGRRRPTRTLTPARALAGLGGHARQDGDRELEALRAVDGQDPHGVVVGLGQQRLVHPRAVGALQLGPLEERPQAAAAGLLERAGLVDEEPQPAPHLGRPRVAEGRAGTPAARAASRSSRRRRARSHHRSRHSDRRCAQRQPRPDGRRRRSSGGVAPEVPPPAGLAGR